MLRVAVGMALQRDPAQLVRQLPAGLVVSTPARIGSGPPGLVDDRAKMRLQRVDLESADFAHDPSGYRTRQVACGHSVSRCPDASDVVPGHVVPLPRTLRAGAPMLAGSGRLAVSSA